MFNVQLDCNLGVKQRSPEVKKVSLVCYNVRLDRNLVV